MKQKTAYGIVTKGNGDAFATFERHMSLSVGGGQAGQGYPCVLIQKLDEAADSVGIKSESRNDNR